MKGADVLNKNEVYKLFKDIIKSGSVLIDEPMKKHTSFKIGGPADIMILPKTIEEVTSVINICRNESIDYFIIGNGSNILVRDKGIRGIVIKLSEYLNKVEVNGDKIIAQSGALLSVVSKFALENSLTGLEFASGIPGSLGGAVAMNAGAYGGEMKDVISNVKCLDKEGNLVEYSNEELNFEYRYSRVQKEELIVLEVEMILSKGNYDDIKSTMNELAYKRNLKQPLHLPSAGSTFKRPKGYYAGKLIEDAGLKGLRMGNAQVSDKHSGFIVNLGNATAEEVINLIRVVQKVVYDKFGVNLEPEVKILGVE